MIENRAHVDKGKFDRDDYYVGKEFGRGTTYSLALFLMHGDPSRIASTKGEFWCHSESDAGVTTEWWVGTWFSSAADHLMHFIVPEGLDPEVKERIELFVEKCCRWRSGKATEKDIMWALEEAKLILLEIDEKLLKVGVTKGHWE
jgi:hypothetical protein